MSKRKLRIMEMIAGAKKIFNNEKCLKIKKLIFI